MVTLVQSDLQFLFNQVTFDPINRTGPSDSSGIREITGNNNNLIPGQGSFGASDTNFVQMSDGNNRSDYADYTPAASPRSPSVIDSMPRIISNLIADQGNNVILNQAPIPGDLPFNSLMTYFGQFFDHGLDFVAKGQQGFIAVPLMPDDPLYIDPLTPGFRPGFDNMMFVSRANVTNLADAGADLTFGTGDDVGYVDTNTNGIVDAGDAFANPTHANQTSAFIDQNQTYGSDGTIRALLTEYEIVNGVAVATGRLLTHADGGLATWADMKANALLIGVTLTDMHVLSGPPLIATDAKGRAIYDANGQVTLVGGTTGHPILMDIAHDAVPNLAGTYDVAGLQNHFVAGDGRINENYGLAAVHSVFHNEHNLVVEQIEAMLALPGQTITMTGLQIFEAAKLVNEMEYQHLVFDEFARRVSPNVGLFDSYDTSINASISSEFAHAVYRLGHSMLTETIPIADPVTGAITANPTLLSAFLNTEGIDLYGEAAILAGLAQQQGSAIDEFVTSALRNSLVGLPLDLATINIVRGRDTGLPTLNEFRQQMFAVEGDPALAAYTSWADFGANMKTPGDATGGSLLNFIAAYAFGDVALASGLIAAKVAASTAMQNAAFMNGTLAANHPLYQQSQSFWDIDLWIGGLAEQNVFGGLLGSTFNLVFANQLQRLQDGDRYYYLERLAGTNLLSEIEGENWSDMLNRTTDATLVNADTFSAAEAYIALHDGNNDISTNRATIGLSEVIEGRGGDDTIHGGAGFDSLDGGAGNDTLEGGIDDDFLTGGAGDDTITDVSGDDFIRGGDGNDTINAGSGFDLVHGGAGNDNIHGGQDDDEIFGGTGNDIVHGDNGGDEAFGGEGDDTLYGDAGADRLSGEAGNDILIGGTGEDRLDGGDGDDVLISGGGGTFNAGSLGERMDGGLGSDTASYETSGQGVTADLVNFLTANLGEAAFDNYSSIENLRGTNFNDNLFGDAIDNVLEGLVGNDLLDGRGGNDTASYQRSNGAVTINLGGNSASGGHATGDTLVAIENLIGSAFDDTLTGDGGANILTGGAGNDVLNGAGGANDVAVFSGQLSDYTFTDLPNIGDGIFNIVDNRGIDNTGAGDTLTNIEFAQFGGNIVSLAALFGGAPIVGAPVNLGAMNEDGTFTITSAQLLTGAFDLNGDPLTVAGLTASTGILTPNGIDQWNFAPPANFNGDVTFNFTVNDGNSAPTAQSANLTVNPVNDAPVSGTDNFNINEDAVTVLTAQDLLGNDGDVDGNTLTINTVSGATNGVAVLNANGTVTFTPTANFSGVATFTYRAYDGTVMGAPTVVTLNIAAVNDAPTAVSDTGAAQAENPASTDFDVKSNDSDIDDANVNGHTIAVVGAAVSSSNGAINGLANAASLFSVVDGQIRYTPGSAMDALNDGQTATFTVTYSLTDPLLASSQATLTFTVDGSDEIFTGSGTIGSSNFDDRQTGDAGADIFFGSLGADEVIGQGGTDTADYSNSTVGITVALDGSLVNTGLAAGDTFVSIENLIGSNFDNILVGNSAANRIEGRDGADKLHGRAGADNLIGGNGDDSLCGGDGADIHNGGAGADAARYDDATGTVRAALDASVSGLGFGAGDTFIGIENLYGSNFNDTLIGNASDNYLSGLVGNDSLSGQSGSDKLAGRDGADTLRGGAGNDTFRYFATNEGGDTILDFSSNVAGNNDRFMFSNAAFGNVGVGALSASEFQSSTSSSAANANVRFFYETDTRILRFDADGLGGAAAVQIAQLQVGATLAINDIIIV